MKMITRCPACTTMFKVVPDQLRLAGGWVRCGQCMAVFDAQAHMVPAEEDVPDDPQWRGEGNAPADDALASGVAPDAAGAGWDAPADTNAGALSSPSASVAAPPPPQPSFTAAAARPLPSARVSVVKASGAAVGVQVYKKPAAPVAPAQVMPGARIGERRPGGATSGEAVTAGAAALSIPTRDELDRRHAKLMEALVRLRENADGRYKSAGALVAEEDSQPPSNGRDVRSDAGTDEQRYRNAELERKYKDEDDTEPPKDEDDTEPPRRKLRSRARDNESGFGSDETRPMIDFVLSEIGVSHVPPSAKAASSDLSLSEPPSFVTQARRRAFWSSPMVRAGTWLASLVLVLLLVVQVAVGMRERLAAQYPSMAPLLTALCRCRIAPWRHLDTVMIDSDRFVRTGPDSFDLGITLRNTGSAPVATPTLDLMLTDAQDQPLVRRVLSPANWGAPPQLAAHSEFTGGAVLTVLDAANPQAVSNYRIAVFYP